MKPNPGRFGLVDSKQGWARGGSNRVVEMGSVGASRVQITKVHCLYGIYKLPALKIRLFFGLRVRSVASRCLLEV